MIFDTLDVVAAWQSHTHFLGCDVDAELDEIVRGDAN
jgi:hypothetical protein